MEKQRFYLTSFDANLNTYRVLRNREYLLKQNYRTHMPIIRSLVCQKTSNFVKIWSQQSSQPISYEDGKVYFSNYRKCANVRGLRDRPQKAYTLPPCPTTEKIEDCITASFPLSEIIHEKKGYRSCKLAVTANNYLKRYDLDTGQLLQQVYLSPRYKFRYIGWNEDGKSFVVKSIHAKMSAIASQAGLIPNVLMVLAVFSVFPLDYIGMLEVTKTVFGRDIADSMISQGLLIVMHQNGYVRLYSLERILEKFKLFDVKLGTAASDPGAPLGVCPTGLPLNIQITEKPDCLFEVKCSEHRLQLGGFPWHYVSTPHKLRGFFEVKDVADKTMAAGGHLELNSLSYEDDKCNFHPDESGRILLIGQYELRVLKIEAGVREGSHAVRTVFMIGSEEGKGSPCNQIDGMTFTSSGRVVKRKHSLAASFLDTQSQIIQSVEYESDLDILIVTKLDQSEGGCRGKVHLHDNQDGRLLKEINLSEPWNEFADHSVVLDLDLVVHIAKLSLSRHSISVYRLDRTTDDMPDTSGSATCKRQPRERPRRHTRPRLDSSESPDRPAIRPSSVRSDNSDSSDRSTTRASSMHSDNTDSPNRPAIRVDNSGSRDRTETRRARPSYRRFFEDSVS